MDNTTQVSSDHIHYNYHHHIDVRGVVIPTWVAILLSVMGLSASLIVLLSVFIFKSAADDLAKSQAEQTKEMRILSLHIQDIESVLIRSKLAERKDFAPLKEGE